MENNALGREKKRIGEIGESKAIEFLKRKGYRILDTNFRTRFGELDLVTKYKDFIVFIEIKTRTTSSLGPPYLSVTVTKQRHIIKNALSYLKMHGLIDSNWRIDIVSVKLNPVRNSENLSQGKNISNGMNYDYEVEDIEIIENAVEDYGGR